MCVKGGWGWGGVAPEGTAATEEEQAGEMIRSLLIDFNLSWIFRAVAKTNHSLIKMIYCLGGVVGFLLSADSQNIKVELLPMGITKPFTSTSGKSPCTHSEIGWFKDSWEPETQQRFFFHQISFPSLPFFVSHGATGVTAPHSLMGQTVSRLGLVSLATAMLGFPP